MSNQNLFLKAFTNKEPAEGGQTGVNSVKRTEEMFGLAFGQPEEMTSYTPPVIVDYELKATNTDSSKLFELQSMMDNGVQYADLPVGLRNIVNPKRKLAKELRHQEDETGFTLEERQSAFNAFQFNIDYLASLANANLPASMIYSEYVKLKDRFPEDAIDESLKETHQQLLSSLKAQDKIQEYKANEEAEEANRVSVAAEIKAAQVALGLQDLSANQVDSVIRGSEAE